MAELLHVPAPRAGQARLAALRGVIPQSAEELFRAPRVLPGHVRIAEAAVAHVKAHPASALQLRTAEALLAVLQDEQAVQPIVDALRAAHEAGAINTAAANHLTRQAVHNRSLGVADLMETGVGHDRTRSLPKSQRNALDVLKTVALAGGAKPTQFFDPLVVLQTMFSPATDDQVNALNRAAGANVPLRDALSAVLRAGLAYALSQSLGGGPDIATVAFMTCAALSSGLKLHAAAEGAIEAHNRGVVSPAAG